MTLLALSAASSYLGDPKLLTGFAVPASGGLTSLASNTGFTVPWAPGLLVFILIGASGTGTATFVAQNGTSNVTSGTLSNSTSYVFGPIPSAFMSNSAATTAYIVQVNMSNVTGNYVGAYLQAPNTSQYHSPFEMAGGVNDY